MDADIIRNHNAIILHDQIWIQYHYFSLVIFKRPIIQNFDIFVDLSLIKLLSVAVGG